jgi:hypothetical protein
MLASEDGAREMKMLSMVLSRIAVIAVVCLVAGSGLASTPHSDPRHRSSLRARVTMADGTARAIILQGVGCTESICSRVRAKDTKADDVWLDGLASIRQISHEATGPVAAVFTFKDGEERQASIIELHRVLYIKGRLGLNHKLDLARLNRIDFE